MTLLDIPRNGRTLTLHQRRNRLAMRYPDMSAAQRERLVLGIDVRQSAPKEPALDAEQRHIRKLERNRAWYHRNKVLKGTRSTAKRVSDSHIIAAYLEAPSATQAAKALGVSRTFALDRLRKLFDEGAVARKTRAPKSAAQEAERKEARLVKKRARDAAMRERNRQKLVRAVARISDEQVLEAYRNSATATEASRKLGFSENAVAKRIRIMRANGVEVEAKEPRYYSDEEIIEAYQTSIDGVEAASKLGLSKSAVTKRIRMIRLKGVEVEPKSRFRTEEEFLSIYQSSRSVDEAARKLGVTTSAVYNRLKWMRARGVQC